MILSAFQPKLESVLASVCLVCMQQNVGGWGRGIRMQRNLMCCSGAGVDSNPETCSRPPFLGTSLTCYWIWYPVQQPRTCIWVLADKPGRLDRFCFQDKFQWFPFPFHTTRNIRMSLEIFYSGSFIPVVELQHQTYLKHSYTSSAEYVVSAWKCKIFTWDSRL